VRKNKIEEIKMKETKIENALNLALDIIHKSQKQAGKTPKKTTKKQEKKQKPKVQPKEISYGETPNILNEMKDEESVARFGFLYKSKTPYQDINSKSITKLYDDYNIKAYKRWSLSYSNKDIIIDRQIKNHNPKGMTASIEHRIDEITKRLDKELKPSDKLTVNNIAKREEFLTKQLETLERRLNE